MSGKTKAAQAARIKELERQLHEARAGQIHTHYFASKGLEKAGHKYLMGSSIIVSMTVLGGRELCAPVAIRDGLSEATIAALQADLRRSWEVGTMLQPPAPKAPS